MILNVPDMSCGHCKASVEAVILKLDPKASVQVDLTARKVEVSTIEPVEAILLALDSVGFPATAA